MYHSLKISELKTAYKYFYYTSYNIIPILQYRLQQKNKKNPQQTHVYIPMLHSYTRIFKQSAVV